MTNTEGVKPVQVIQADRDAAAECCGRPSEMRRGKMDGHNLVQAFARHRLTHQPATAEQPKEISNDDDNRRVGAPVALGADSCCSAPLLSSQELAAQPVGDVERRWKLGDLVCKKKGSGWHGRVVGFYSTELTPTGYAVESEFERGSVQIYPEAALEDWPADAIEQGKHGEMG